MFVGILCLRECVSVFVVCLKLCVFRWGVYDLCECGCVYCLCVCLDVCVCLDFRVIIGCV